MKFSFVNFGVILVGLNFVVSSSSVPSKSYRKLTNYQNGDGQSIEDNIWSTDNIANDILPSIERQSPPDQTIPETVKPEMTPARPEVTSTRPESTSSKPASTSTRPEIVTTLPKLLVTTTTESIIDKSPSFKKPTKTNKHGSSDGLTHFLNKIWTKNGNRWGTLSQILTPEKVSDFLRNMLYHLPGETRVHGVVTVGGSAINFDMTKNETDYKVWKSEVDKTFEFVDANVAKIEDDKKDKKRPDDHDRDRVDYLDDSTEIDLKDKIDAEVDDDADFETFLLDFFNDFTEDMGGDSFLRNVANVGLMSAVGILLFSVMAFMMVITMTAMFVPVLMLFAAPIMFMTPMFLAFGQ